MNFAIGSLVKARGREWVVLPESQDDPDWLILRPLGGGDDERTGLYRPLEKVEPAEFSLPDPSTELGNHLSCGLLRNAVRLGFRSGAGPFRSLARIAVEPRPYQLVPLLMALRLDPIRLLIADDVGVGKTVEALLIARELLDRGEIRRLAVLCPPHLAEQWQKDLRDQFHLEAALVLPGTAARLERDNWTGERLFHRHPITVVSMDYIKSERRRYDFLEDCPECVIVDEAHSCSSGSGSAGQKRHELLKDLVKDASRHLILVTATPHSGKEETFRSLLGLLDPSFLQLPENLGGEENRARREALARHFVQRRRGDLADYMEESTPFPQREIAEEHYALHPDYRRFFDRMLDYCRERVQEKNLTKQRQRVYWWSALAMLRALSSSPAAAAATLRTRAAGLDAADEEEADERGRRGVMDLDFDGVDALDVPPGSQVDEEGEPQSESGRLARFAREVESFKGDKDLKLIRAAQLVRSLIRDGYSPIVFCRFIATAEYVAQELREELSDLGVEVKAVTGLLHSADREARVAALADHAPRLLVATDCLSEGINLQHSFDAVLHYDLSWNPTRHEQREGRVDRYGQPKDVVRTLTYFGKDNPIDGIVLDVLLRKHRAIRSKLGIIVPVPMDTNDVLEAVLEGLLMRGRQPDQMVFDFARQQGAKVETQWEAAVEREKKSRTIFAQRSIEVADVVRELAEVRRALGDEADVEAFVTAALESSGAQLTKGTPLAVDLTTARSSMRRALADGLEMRVVFHPPAPAKSQLLTRTHPFVEELSSYIMGSALDAQGSGIARRCGVVRTRQVERRTALLLLRLRFHIQAVGGGGRPLLAEDQMLAAFRGTPSRPEWLDPAETEALLEAQPAANIAPELARGQLERLLADFAPLQGHLSQLAAHRSEELLDAHTRVRRALRSGPSVQEVKSQPPEVLGIYIYLPVPPGEAR